MFAYASFHIKDIFLEQEDQSSTHRHTRVNFSNNEANAQPSKANTLFAAIFHANPIPTALTRLEDGLLLDANAAYLRFFELERDSVIGQSTNQLGHWLPLVARVELAARVQHEGHVRNVELHMQSITGERKTALVSIERVEIDGLQGAVSTFVDISERKRTEEALRHSEERLQLTLSSIVDHAIITLDANNIIIGWNSGAEEIFGFRADEAIGQPGDLIFTPEDRANGVPAREVEQARTTGRAMDERWHMRRDGSRVFMSGVLVPLQGHMLIGYVKIARDLTERRQMEEALERMVIERTTQVRDLVNELTMSEQEERRRISSILHDDLQQRLFSMIFQLYTVRDFLEADPEAARTTITEIEEALQTSVQITRQLSVDLSPPVLHGEGLLEALRWLANRMHQQHGLQVRVQADTPLPVPNEDLRVLLFQIVRELLFNVVKHAGVNQAQIALTYLNNRVRIEVSDQGCGFTPGGAEGKGSQISQGLQRIEQRLNLLGGQMKIESTPGRGTRITLVSPLQGREEDRA